MASRPPASEAGAYPGSATSAGERAADPRLQSGRLARVMQPAAVAAARVVPSRGASRGGPPAGRPWPGAAPAWAVPRPGRGGDASPPPLCLEGRSRRPPLSEGAAGEVGDELRRRGVEADDVEHPRVVRVGDREAVRDHADHDQPCLDAGGVAVVAERLSRMDVARPG